MLQILRPMSCRLARWRLKSHFRKLPQGHPDRLKAKDREIGHGAQPLGVHVYAHRVSEIRNDRDCGLQLETCPLCHDSVKMNHDKSACFKLALAMGRLKAR